MQNRRKAGPRTGGHQYIGEGEETPSAPRQIPSTPVSTDGTTPTNPASGVPIPPQQQPIQVCQTTSPTNRNRIASAVDSTRRELRQPTTNTTAPAPIPTPNLQVQPTDTVVGALSPAHSSPPGRRRSPLRPARCLLKPTQVIISLIVMDINSPLQLPHPTRPPLVALRTSPY
ncbi:proline-rich protein 36-like [Ptychodera flava]|uniref:proline-rich protein 36-like n=1 Tax=Ptychodera flava TaxID=63121 RepID=UPI00396A80EB